jgi:hypothetical protein
VRRWLSTPRPLGGPLAVCCLLAGPLLLLSTPWWLARCSPRGRWIETRHHRMLNKGGIRRVVVGHTPHGMCPTIIKSGGPGMVEPGLMVVMADTSYSDMKAADNRGRAVSEVQLLDNGQVRPLRVERTAPPNTAD